MDPTPSTPLFPLEIFNLIIEELVEDPDHLAKNPETFNRVKDCAVVCRSFAALCQPYIFRIISGIKVQYGTDKRTKNFMHIMKSNPNLSRHVRHLNVDSSEPAGQSTLSRDGVSEIMEVLKGFPNLIKLEIENCTNRYNMESALVGTYLYQESLRSLSLIGLDNWFLDDDFSCSEIRAIGLGSLIMPTISAPHITRLVAEDTRQMDLGALCFFPNLEEFFLSHSYVLAKHRQSAPSFVLRVLCMSVCEPGGVTTLLNFYNDYAEMNGVQPFGKLEELKYDPMFEEESDVEALERILQTTRLLKVLNINTTLGLFDDPTFPLARLQLARKILDVFPHLTTLNLRLNVNNLYDYNGLMTDIADIFVDIEGKNIIQSVSILIEAEASMFDLIPSCEQWSRMSRSLSSCAAYPKLQVLSAQFRIHGIHNGIQWRRSHATYMSHAMKEVVARQGVTFEGKMDLRFTYDGI